MSGCVCSSLLVRDGVSPGWRATAFSPLLVWYCTAPPCWRDRAENLNPRRCSASACVRDPLRRPGCNVEALNHQVQQMSSCWWGWLSPSMIIRSRQGAFECRCLQAGWVRPCVCVCVNLSFAKNEIWHSCSAPHREGRLKCIFSLSLHGQCRETGTRDRCSHGDKSGLQGFYVHMAGDDFPQTVPKPFIGVIFCFSTVKHTVEKTKKNKKNLTRGKK